MILQELEQGKKAWRAVDDLAKFDFQNSESNRLDTSDASAQLLHFQIKTCLYVSLNHDGEQSNAQTITCRISSS